VQAADSGFTADRNVVAGRAVVGRVLEAGAVTDVELSGRRVQRVG